MNNVFTQLNQNMRQSHPEFGFNNQQVNIAPFETNQGYGRNETQAIDFIPTKAPIEDQTQATTTRTFNASNLNPRTYMGGNAAGSLPYGFARGQLSLFTDPITHRPGKLLVMSNAPVFEQVAKEERMVYVKPSTLGGGT